MGCPDGEIMLETTHKCVASSSLRPRLKSWRRDCWGVMKAAMTTPLRLFANVSQHSRMTQCQLSKCTKPRVEYSRSTGCHPWKTSGRQRKLRSRRSIKRHDTHV